MKITGLYFFVLLIGLSAEVLAQNTPVDTTSANRQTIDDIFSKEPPASSSVIPGMPVIPRGVGVEEMDEETREKYFEALRGHFQYRIDGFEHRQGVFGWQLFSAKIIFWVVIFLVAAGIFFSWMQFRNSLKTKEAGAEIAVNETTLEASAKGIKVSSPVLGVIILVISLLFFYLYLVYVYPIEEIF